MERWLHRRAASWPKTLGLVFAVAFFCGTMLSMLAGPEQTFLSSSSSSSSPPAGLFRGGAEGGNGRLQRPWAVCLSQTAAAVGTPGNTVSMAQDEPEHDRLQLLAKYLREAPTIPCTTLLAGLSAEASHTPPVAPYAGIYFGLEASSSSHAAILRQGLIFLASESPFIIALFPGRAARVAAASAGTTGTAACEGGEAFVVSAAALLLIRPHVSKCVASTASAETPGDRMFECLARASGITCLRGDSTAHAFDAGARRAAPAVVAALDAVVTGQSAAASWIGEPRLTAKRNAANDNGIAAVGPPFVSEWSCGPARAGGRQAKCQFPVRRGTIAAAAAAAAASGVDTGETTANGMGTRKQQPATGWVSGGNSATTSAQRTLVLPRGSERGQTHQPQDAVFTLVPTNKNTWMELELMLRSLRAAQSESASNAVLVAFVHSVSSAAATGLRALGAAQLVVVVPVSTAAGPASAVLLQETAHYLRQHHGVYRNVLLAPVPTIFQTNPFVALAPPGTNAGPGGIVFFSDPYHQTPALGGDEPPSVGSLGICTAHDAAGNSHKPAVRPDLMFGEASVMEYVTSTTLQWYAEAQLPFKGTSCTVGHVLSRLVWAKTIADSIAVTVHNLETPPVLNIRRDSVNVEAHWSVQGSGLFVAHSAASREPVSMVIGYDQEFSATEAGLVPKTEARAAGGGWAAAALAALATKNGLTKSKLSLPPPPPQEAASSSERNRALGVPGEPAQASGRSTAVAADLDSLKVTYESCIARLGTGVRPKKLKKLLWLHLPKCGTSLGTAIHGYLCQPGESPVKNPHYGKGPGKRVCDYCSFEQMNSQGTPFWDGKIRLLLPRDPEVDMYCDWNVTYRGWFFGHNPLRPGTFGHDGPDVVALFRDPRRRAVSAWNHNKHTHHLGTKDAESKFPKSRELLEKETQTVSDFARHKHVQACQTKMVVGGQCGMYHEIDADLFQKAKENVEKMAFVGLTEYYNASVCLFHEMLGGQPQPYMFKNARPADAHKKAWKPRKLPGGGMQERPSAWETLSKLDDPMDYELFLHAKRIFVRKLQEYGYIAG